MGKIEFDGGKRDGTQFLGVVVVFFLVIFKFFFLGGGLASLRTGNRSELSTPERRGGAPFRSARTVARCGDRSQRLRAAGVATPVTTTAKLHCFLFVCRQSTIRSPTGGGRIPRAASSFRDVDDNVSRIPIDVEELVRSPFFVPFELSRGQRGPLWENKNHAQPGKNRFKHLMNAKKKLNSGTKKN